MHLPLFAPTFEGHAHLRFRCTECGACCKSLRVAVTHHDVLRLMRATGKTAAELVAWLAPDDVDMTGEPDTFVELGPGRRLMVLAQRDGACTLLGADNRCGAYTARPRDCELFPFDPELAKDGTLQKLELLPFSACEAASDGANDARALASSHTRRQHELDEYRQRVRAWNQLALRRRRFRHPVGGSARFFTFLGVG
jgi:Fe-S-cluster containining protein